MLVTEFCLYIDLSYLKIEAFTGVLAYEEGSRHERNTGADFNTKYLFKALNNIKEQSLLPCTQTSIVGRDAE